MIGNVIGGIKELKNGDWQSTTRGLIDIANGIANFMAPPAGQLLQSVAAISELFIGILSHDVMNKTEKQFSPRPRVNT